MKINLIKFERRDVRGKGMNGYRFKRVHIALHASSTMQFGPAARTMHRLTQSLFDRMEISFIINDNKTKTKKKLLLLCCV